MHPILFCRKCLHHFGLLRNSAGVVEKTHNSIAGDECDKNCDGKIEIHTPTYAGIFLDDASKSTLLDTVRPAFPNVYGDHITLAHSRHMFERYPLGRVIQFEVFSALRDIRGQCVTVKPEPFKDILWNRQSPHITISCADGIRPVYSNSMIERYGGLDEVHVTMSLILTGTVDYFPRLIAKPSP